MAHDSARFRKIGNQVDLAGKVSGAAATDIAVFTLPEGHRPATESQFPVASACGTSIVTVAPDGRVLADTKDEWVSFDGISFRAD